MALKNSSQRVAASPMRRRSSPGMGHTGPGKHGGRPWFGRLAILALTLLGAASAQANYYYVNSVPSGAQDGSDWNNAAPQLPEVLVRGNTYYLAEGTYPGRVFDTPTDGTTLIIIKKAVKANHGTSVGWNDDYGDEPANFSNGLVFASSYWVLDGHTGGGAANNWGQNFGIKITETEAESALLKIGQNVTADHIIIRHVDLQGMGKPSNSGGSYSNDGLAIYGASDVTLSYFRMTGIGRCPFYISPSNLLVEHGWVQSYYGSDEVHSEVASIWAFAGTLGDVTFRHNLITDIQNTGGIMWDNSSNTSARLTVYGNIFYKPEGATWERSNGLIGGWKGSQGEQFRNATVSHNTFINVDQESLGVMPNVHSGNAAYSNVFFNSMSPDFAKFERYDDNHLVQSVGMPPASSDVTISSGDPFVNYKGLDFRLKPTEAGAPARLPSSLDVE